MEENENENWNWNPWEFFKSIEIVTMVSSSKTIYNLSSLSSNDPLFSCIVTLYVLILLYFPQSFSLKILFSPVLILTASLLLSLLRLGAIQTETKEKRSVAEAEVEAEKTDFSQQELKWETCNEDPEPKMQSFEETFVEWDVRAPLEVIYEAYEEGEDPKENDPNSTRVIERYPSLSLYYPESDSDSSSSETDFLAIGNGFSSEKICYSWEEEDREGLIEIALDKKDLDFRGEEDNLIEIDISSLKG
ncbi:uncharacterized protein LOC111318766 [Durio zibethinus]|uniref:Uncharacterized protein LOC111318766 n=1 Tax=Durio zibethinus TaxID=66656 RepID=A0A6P6BJX8_DURZI|nr:uncharacterized protein LOC111318766 [Durio zibethinus]